MRRRFTFFTLVISCCLIGGSAYASLSFNQDITGNMIFGSGNSNGGFTIDTANGIELGLRAKVRYPSPSDATGTGVRIISENTYGYFDATGHQSDGTSPGPRASWSVDWSINSGTANLNEFLYSLELDYDPGWGTDFHSAYFVADPINLPNNLVLDHSFGNSTTDAGEGTEANDAAEYADLVQHNNLVQNSLNFEFFDLTNMFDPTVDGRYTVQLTAWTRNGAPAAKSVIHVQVGNGVVPEPASLLTWGGIISCVGLIRRRRVG